MLQANFLLYNDFLEINNVTEINEFSDTIFVLKVFDVYYKITGTNLVLSEASTDNKKLKVTGIIETIEIKNKQRKKDKNFLKKLFS